MSEESAKNANSTNHGQPHDKKKPNKKEKSGQVDIISKFRGDGLSFKAKLYGQVGVKDARGDDMCQKALQLLKGSVKTSSQHKQKVLIRINLDGVVIVDPITNQRLQEHNVKRISFISKDCHDSRSFSYVVGTPDGKHTLYGIKTDKPAEAVLLTFRDLFQAVCKLKENSQKRISQSSNESVESNKKSANTSVSTSESQHLPANVNSTGNTPSLSPIAEVKGGTANSHEAPTVAAAIPAAEISVTDINTKVEIAAFDTGSDGSSNCITESKLQVNSGDSSGNTSGGTRGGTSGGTGGVEDVVDGEHVSAADNEDGTQLTEEIKTVIDHPVEGDSPWTSTITAPTTTVIPNQSGNTLPTIDAEESSGITLSSTPAIVPDVSFQPSDPFSDQPPLTDHQLNNDKQLELGTTGNGGQLEWGSNEPDTDPFSPNFSFDASGGDSIAKGNDDPWGATEPTTATTATNPWASFDKADNWTTAKVEECPWDTSETWTAPAPVTNNSLNREEHSVAFEANFDQVLSIDEPAIRDENVFSPDFMDNPITECKPNIESNTTDLCEAKSTPDIVTNTEQTDIFTNSIAFDDDPFANDKPFFEADPFADSCKTDILDDQIVEASPITDNIKINIPDTEVVHTDPIVSNPQSTQSTSSHSDKTYDSPKQNAVASESNIQSTLDDEGGVTDHTPPLSHINSASKDDFTNIFSEPPALLNTDPFADSLEGSSTDPQSTHSDPFADIGEMSASTDQSRNVDPFSHNFEPDNLNSLVVQADPVISTPQSIQPSAIKSDPFSDLDGFLGVTINVHDKTEPKPTNSSAEPKPREDNSAVDPPNASPIPAGSPTQDFLPKKPTPVVSKKANEQVDTSRSDSDDLVSFDPPSCPPPNLPPDALVNQEDVTTVKRPAPPAVPARRQATHPTPPTVPVSTPPPAVPSRNIINKPASLASKQVLVGSQSQAVPGSSFPPTSPPPSLPPTSPPPSLPPTSPPSSLPPTSSAPSLPPSSPAPSLPPITKPPAIPQRALSTEPPKIPARKLSVKSNSSSNPTA